jgi:hypothetical protein
LRNNLELGLVTAIHVESAEYVLLLETHHSELYYTDDVPWLWDPGLFVKGTTPHLWQCAGP